MKLSSSNKKVTASSTRLRVRCKKQAIRASMKMLRSASKFNKMNGINSLGGFRMISVRKSKSW